MFFLSLLFNTQAFYIRGSSGATQRIFEYLVNHFLYLVPDRHKRHYSRATLILPVSRDLQGRSSVVCILEYLKCFPVCPSVFLLHIIKQLWLNTLLTSSLWVKLIKEVECYNLKSQYQIVLALQRQQISDSECSFQYNGGTTFFRFCSVYNSCNIR